MPTICEYALINLSSSSFFTEYSNSKYPFSEDVPIILSNSSLLKEIAFKKLYKLAIPFELLYSNSKFFFDVTLPDLRFIVKKSIFSFFDTTVSNSLLTILYFSFVFLFIKEIKPQIRAKMSKDRITII